MNPSNSSVHPIRGGLYITAAALLFSTMSATVKLASETMPWPVVVFGRNLFGFVLLAFWVLGIRRESVRTGRLGIHILRAVFGLGAMYCFFFAIGHIPLAEAVLLTYTAPLLIPFLARLVLREHLPPTILLPVLLGFVGLLLILKPGTALFQPEAVVGLCSGIFAACAMVSIRGLSATEPTGRIVFYFAAFGSLISAVPAAPSLPGLDGPALLLLLGLGTVASLGQICLTRGYASAPAGQVGPFIYTAVVWSSLIGWAFWGEELDALSFAGALLVCLAGILALRQGRLPPSLFTWVSRLGRAP